MITFASKHCHPYDLRFLLSAEEASTMLHEVSGWELKQGGVEFSEFFGLQIFNTIAFVNAVAWVANKENHHPRLKVEYEIF